MQGKINWQRTRSWQLPGLRPLVPSTLEYCLFNIFHLSSPGAKDNMALLPPSARAFLESVKLFGLCARSPLATKAIISSSALEPSPPATQWTLGPACGQLSWTVLGARSFGTGGCAGCQEAFSFPSPGDTGPATWSGDILVSSPDVPSELRMQRS